MARIDVYQNNRTLDIGGVVRQNANTDTGRALSNLGGAVVDVASDMLSERKKADAKIAARAENLDNLRLHSELIGHEDRVATFAQEQAANFLGEGSDGAGYQKAVNDFAEKDAKQTISTKFGSRQDPEEVAIRFSTSTHGVIRKVGEDEFNAGLKFQGDVSEKKIAGLATKLSINPDEYDNAAREWVDFAANTNMDRPLLQQHMATLGLAKLQRARVEALAGRDPDAFVSSLSGAFTGTPTEGQPKHIADTVHGANNAGIDPNTLLAIGKIESDLNPKAGKPTRADGSTMSSAEGMFQVLSASDTLDELGITADQKYDTAVVAPALAAYIKRKTDFMVSRGIEPTPGKQYMYWNMGPGVATAVLQADPRANMGDIVDRVLAKRSPEFRADVKRNNPSLYSAGMTAGQVIANFEKKVESARKATASLVTGGGVQADDQAQSVFAKLVPGGAPMLGAKDLGEIATMARAKSAELSREQQSLNRGMSYTLGMAKGDPRDSTVQKDVNEYVIRQGVTTGLVEGDQAAHDTANKIVENVGFVPDAIMNSYSAALAGGDVKGKMTAYVSLSGLSARNPGAYDATKMPADDRARVNEYVALTTVSNLTPEDAIRRIDFYRSPEGKKQAEAQKAGLQTTRTAEVKALSELDVVRHFDEKWTSSQPTDVSGKFLAAATDAYKEQYAYYRETGMPVADAKSMALASLDKHWGSSRVSDTGKGANTQTFMPFPPEKSFKPNDEGFSWIQDQARNQAVAFIEQRYPALKEKYKGFTRTTGRGPSTTTTTDASTLKDVLNIKLVPDIETAHEVRSSRAPGYRLMIRLPDGQVDFAAERFHPDQTQADREAADRFRTGNKNARKAPTPNTPLDLQGP